MAIIPKLSTYACHSMSLKECERLERWISPKEYERLKESHFRLPKLLDLAQLAFNVISKQPPFSAQTSTTSFYNILCEKMKDRSICPVDMEQLKAFKDCLLENTQDFQEAFIKAIQSNNIEVIYWLLIHKNKDITINVRYFFYLHLIPLHLAAECGHREIVELLLDRGADINARANYNRTALHLAAERGHREIVELLLDRGADINIRTNYNRTALHIAALWGNREIAELLLDRGADIKIRDDDNLTALNLAIWKDNREITELL